MRKAPQPGDLVVIRDDLGDDFVIAVNNLRVVRIPSGSTGVCVSVSVSGTPNKNEREAGRAEHGAYDVDVLVNGMIVTLWDEEVELVR